MKQAKSRPILRAPASEQAPAHHAAADKQAAINAMADVTGGGWAWQNASANGYNKSAHNITVSPEMNAMLEFAIERGMIRSKRSFIAEAAEKAMQEMVEKWVKEQEILAKNMR